IREPTRFHRACEALSSPQTLISEVQLPRGQDICSSQVRSRADGRRNERRLTEALLYVDFEISLSLPDNRLCPPVSTEFPPHRRCFRLNYVLWIQDIVKETAPDVETVRGLDVCVLLRGHAPIPYRIVQRNRGFRDIPLTGVSTRTYVAVRRYRPEEVAQSAEAKEFGPNAVLDISTCATSPYILSDLYWG
ncbi:hypothetical protein ID866_2548, partial [Astraeus odoratus]